MLTGAGVLLSAVLVALLLVGQWDRQPAGGRVLPAPPRSAGVGAAHPAHPAHPAPQVRPASPKTAPGSSTLDLSGDPTGGTSTLSAPAALSIPAIGVQTTVVALGRNPDGSATVPSGTTYTSWYDLGPTPGEIGPAVILGHVDSSTGPGVFFDLKDLLPGDTLTVDDGVIPVTFQVTRIATYAKDAFPTSEVFGATPDAELRLITCGGPFDTAIGHYEDNVVVYASLLHVAPVHAARPRGRRAG